MPEPFPPAGAGAFAARAPRRSQRPRWLRRLRALVRHRQFAQGMRATSAISMGIGAWGLVTGIAMIDSGLGWPLSTLMSLLVYAGTAQLAALPLLMAHAPIGLVVATAICVNLRFLIFSFSWRPFLIHLPLWRRLLTGYCITDLGHVLFMQRFGGRPPAPGQLPFFWGGAVLNWCVWQSMTFVGMGLANVLPRHWGLGFAGTLAMLGLALSLMNDRATWIAAGVSAAAAVATFALPLKLNLVVAIAAAVAVGLVADGSRRVAR